MNFFEPVTQQQILHRINNLTTDAKPQWGKMTAAQMLKHLTLTMKAPLDKLNIARGIKGKFSNPLLRWLILKLMLIPKNIPTDPLYLVTDEVEFNEAKVDYLKYFHELSKVPEDYKFGMSPAFGDMDKKMWGELLFTHTVHHLKQFRV